MMRAKRSVALASASGSATVAGQPVPFITPIAEMPTESTLGIALTRSVSVFTNTSSLDWSRLKLSVKVAM